MNTSYGCPRAAAREHDIVAAVIGREREKICAGALSSHRGKPEHTEIN